MCMKISKEDLVRINKGFGGNVRNEESIDFAIGIQINKKLGDYKKLAYLIRAIIVDHPFTDGNKRTAWATTHKFIWDNGYHLKAGKKEAADFMVNVDNQKPDIVEISKWLINHSVKIRKSY